MSEQKRHTITILFVVLVSLTLLAAPARGDDWFGVQIGSRGFGIGFGSTDWVVYGSSWANPSWTVDYHVALAGYGEWVWVDGIGQCWRPWVRPDWRPFTYGRWVWTTYGWTWVAYEPWGYFPHHYGHWAMTHAGWVWAPGTTYVPANVVWVQLGTRVGWYASPPPGWSHSRCGFGVGYAQGRHDGFSHGYQRGVADGYWAGWNDARYATFVDWDHLGSEDLGRASVSAAAVRGSAASAVPRAGIEAPSRTELARRGVSVPEMTLERRTARVAGRDVMVARPREAASSVERNARSTVERTLTPAAVETLHRRRAVESANSQRSAGPPTGTVERSPDRIGGSRATSGRQVERREPVPVAITDRVAPRSGSQPPSPSPHVASRGAARAAAPANSQMSPRPTFEPTAPRSAPSPVGRPADTSTSPSRRRTDVEQRGGMHPSPSSPESSARARSAAASAPELNRRIATRASESQRPSESASRPSPTASSESRGRSEARSDDTDGGRLRGQVRSSATSQRR